MSDYQDIAEALMHPENQDRSLARITLRYAVQRAIFCVYCGHLLDIREAVLLDGSDYGTKSDVMHGAEYDKVISATGDVEGLKAKLGYQVDVQDGRVLFA